MTTPFISCDNNNIPSYIDGKFSDKIVKNAADAIEALNDIHHIMQFENAEQEYVEVYTETVGNTIFYRLQQVYHNISVDGYQLVISTSNDGVIQSLTGHYYPNLTMDTSPKISVEQAKDIVRQHEFKKSNANIDPVSNGLCIFFYGLKSSPELAWNITTLFSQYFISATDGRIISGGTFMNMSTSGGISSSGGGLVSFPILQIEDKFFLQDEFRNIEMYDGKSQYIEQTIENSIIAGDSRDKIINEYENYPKLWSKHFRAIRVYRNLIKIYDYYSNILGRNGADDCHLPIRVVVDFCDGVDEGPEYLDWCDNAGCATYPTSTYIIVGHEL